MVQIKTVTTGSTEEVIIFDKFDFLHGAKDSIYVWIRNMGDTDIYASAEEGIVAGADGVTLVKAGAAGLLTLPKYNKIHVLGASTLECHAQFFSECPVRGMAGGGGGSGVVVESLSVDHNDTYTAPSGKAYSPVVVDVPNTYVAADEGKVVSSGALVSQSSLNVTQNDTYDTTLKNSVVVSVPNTYVATDEGKVVSNGALVSQSSLNVTQNDTYDTTLKNSVSVNVQPNLGTKNITDNGTYTASSDNLDGYSSVTVNVQPKTVNFYDYDGTIVQSYTAAEFAELTAMPENPTHNGLTAQGWNWSLADAKTYVASYGKLDIGQMYTTDDGATRLHIRLADGRLSPVLGLCPNGTLTIDWGDGSATETMTGTSTSTLVYLPHTYSQAGEYTISITPTSGSIFGFGQRGDAASLLCKSSSDNTTERAVYLSTINNINLGDGVTSISDYAFNNCLSLLSIIIPNGVTTIGQNAFYYCYSLSSITIPNTVTTIGSDVFYNCYSLSSITIPNGVTTISSSAFCYCSSLSSITIPNGVTTIGDDAFNSCTSLSSITIPNTVTTIGSSAFCYCSSLSSITIPNGVTTIGDDAFNSCTSLSSITIPNTVTTIGSSAFGNCYSLSSITIPNGVTTIDSYAFCYCYSLSSITIPNTVTTIGSDVFSNCYSLSSITIPNTVRTIDLKAFFYYCYSLSSITIPNTVTTIGQSAFRMCYGLGYVKFTNATPPTVSNANAFSGIPTDCIIYVPQSSLSAYTSASNYPDSNTYQYVGY